MTSATPPQRLKCHRNEKYLDFVREHDCLRCRAPAPSEAAHVRKGNGGGTGIKPSDYRTLPLCHACHAHQHQVGEEAFWARLGDGADIYIVRLLAKYVGDRRALIEILENIIEEERAP